MMNYPAQLLAIAAAASTMTLASACRIESENQEQYSIALEGATAVAVSLEMDSGELDISGGSPALMDADLSFPESNPPLVAYAIEDTVGYLDIYQHDDDFFTIAENHWEISFNDNVPMALQVEMDNGDADLELGDLMLEQLDFTIDNGDATIDLGGDPRVDLSAYVQVDNGHARLRLPAQAAARITVDLDNGDIDAPGFARDSSGAYVRDGSLFAPLYDIHVELDNGEVDLEIAY